MGEPESEPGAQPEILVPQCENTETAEINRDTDGPLSPNSINEVAVPEMEDKGTVRLAGELSAIAEVTLGEEKEETGAMAGDGNPSVKEEVAEAEEGSKLEVERPSVQFSQPVETEALPEAAIAGTEEAAKEEGSKIDRAVKSEEGDDDQMELSMKEEVGPAVKTGSVSQEGAVGEVMIAGSDDTMPKEEDQVEQEVGLMDDTERKEEDVAQTDDEAPRLDQELVRLETNNEEADELQPEDNNPTQDEETNMDESMHDDPGVDKAMDEDLTQDGDGDKAMDEDLSEDGDGDKAMDEDLTQDGDGDKAVNEPSIGVDADGLDDDAADDQATKHEEEVMGTNDGEEDEDEDEPPPLPAKKSGNGRKKRGRATRIKKGEEELCFICFDGGELVVCDRRSDY